MLDCEGKVIVSPWRLDFTPAACNCDVTPHRTTWETDPLSKTISRPDAPNHFMVLRPVQKKIVIRLPNGPVLASSAQAIRLMESGKSLYDPVLYLPRDDVSAPLTTQSNHSFCPLKGEASYFGYDDGDTKIDDLAWSYGAPLDFSEPIKGLIAFYANKVIIEEHPLLREA